MLTGPLEPYVIAKIAGIKMVEPYRTQYGSNCINVMPTISTPAAQSRRANCRDRLGRNRSGAQAFMPEECANYFKIAGYAST
jgi:hypothetical protein